MHVSTDKAGDLVNNCHSFTALFTNPDYFKKATSHGLTSLSGRQFHFPKTLVEAVMPRGRLL
jgi:hypothetical protein